MLVLYDTQHFAYDADDGNASVVSWYTVLASLSFLCMGWMIPQLILFMDWSGINDSVDELGEEIDETRSAQF